MLLMAFAIAVGFALLVWGADRFVVGAKASSQGIQNPEIVDRMDVATDHLSQHANAGSSVRV